MEGRLSSSCVVIRDERQAAFLTDPRSKLFFTPFLGESRTVKEAADVVGCAVNTMLYRVKVMVEAGLLQVVAVRKRNGRPMKVYRSTSDAYFIPLAATAFDTIEHRALSQGEPIFRHLVSAYTKALQEHEHRGHLVYAEGGVVHTTDLPPAHLKDGRSLFFHDLTTELSASQAQDIAGRLRDTLAAAERAPIKGEKTGRYIVMLALVPGD